MVRNILFKQSRVTGPASHHILSEDMAVIESLYGMINI